MVVVVVTVCVGCVRSSSSSSLLLCVGVCCGMWCCGVCESWWCWCSCDFVCLCVSLYLWFYESRYLHVWSVCVYRCI